MKSIKDSIGLALQIAYEYENWNEEHVSDMLATYTSCGDKPPCSYDELMDLAIEAAEYKQKCITFSDAEKLMLKKRR